MSKTFIITKKNIPMITGMIAKNLCNRTFIKGYHCFDTGFKKKVKHSYLKFYSDVDVSYNEDQIFIQTDEFTGIYVLNVGDRVRFAGNRVEIAIYYFSVLPGIRNLYLEFSYESRLKRLKHKV